MPLGGHEDEDIARGGFAAQFVDGVEDRAFQIGVGVVVVFSDKGPISDINWIISARDLDHGGRSRRGTEVAAEMDRVDRGRGDDQLEVAPLREEPLQVADEKVDVQRTFVGLVKDDRVVLVEIAVALGLGQEDAVGHELDEGAGAGLVGEADLVAHVAAQRRADFFSHAGGDRTGSDPPGLGMADHAGDAAAHIETDLGQLGRFARAGLAGDDNHLVIANGGGDLLAFEQDGQIVAELDPGHGGRPSLSLFDGTAQLPHESVEFTVQGLPAFLPVAERAQALTQAILVDQHRMGDFCVDFAEVGHPIISLWETGKPFSLPEGRNRVDGRVWSPNTGIVCMVRGGCCEG